LRSLLFVTMPIFGFLLALGCALIGSRDTVGSDIARCLSHDCFDRESASRLKEPIAPFVRGSRFEGKVNTETVPRDGFLNLYVTKSPPEGRLASIKCNCAYVGLSTVICDKAFLDTFSKVVNFTRQGMYGKDVDAIWAQNQAMFDQVNKRISDVLMAWILGHEIGHAILHGESNFGRRRPFTRDQELEADRFFIERYLVGADGQRIQNLSFGLSQIIFTVVGIAMNVPGARQETPRKAAIAPSPDGIHPPWLVRALLLGQEISELQHKSDGFYSGLSSNVVERKGGIDVGTFCASENLREVQAHLQEQRLKSAD
jgi:hypothetical protein